MERPIIENTFHYKGFQCCIIFQPYGYRCGYVLVPQWHSCFEQDYDDIPVKCHGGLTYSSHKLMERKYPGWWIGFDCAHAGDTVDRYSWIRYYGEEEKQGSFLPLVNLMSSDFGTVKTLDFCIQECKNIVDQLVEDRE